jgi:Flp pilus assembly protein TadG
MATISSLRKEHGQALVEFALVAPVLLLLLFGIVQFGIAFNNSISLTDAVRAGARAAVVAGPGLDAQVAAAKSAIAASAGGLDPARIVVTVTQPDDTDVTVTATYPYSVDVLGVVVDSGRLSSSTTERLD